MGKTEFRWLVIRGQPVAGAIRFGGPQDNLWQVLQYRELEAVLKDGSNGTLQMSEWKNVPLTFAQP